MIGTKLGRRLRVPLLVSIVLAGAMSGRAAAQQELIAGPVEGLAVSAAPQAAANAPIPAGAASARQGVGVGDVVRFLAGGAAGLALHESGHLATDCLFDAHPGIKKVQFGPIPFFAITHRGDLSPRREFTVSSAGFWVQQLGNEILLSRHPGLRREHAPARKGLLAFNILASVAYAGGAMAKAGPPERDTRSMAVFLGADESAVAAMLLVPAAVDTVRYLRPGSRWLPWAARAAKVAMVMLVVKSGRR